MEYHPGVNRMHVDRTIVFEDGRQFQHKYRVRLYSVYELAPRFHGLAAGTDQQIAGLVMKLGGIPIIWGTMLAICVKWLRPAEFSAGTRISGDGTVIPSSSEPDAVA